VAQEAIAAFCLSGMQAAGRVVVVVVELPSPNSNPYRTTTIIALAAIAAPVTPAEAKAGLFGTEMARPSNLVKFTDRSTAPLVSRSKPKTTIGGGLVLSTE